MTPTLRTSHLILLAALVSLGCASTTATSPAAAPAVPEPPTAAREAPGEAALQPAGAAALDPVYFDTDRALLRADARAALKARAEAILARMTSAEKLQPLTELAGMLAAAEMLRSGVTTTQDSHYINFHGDSIDGIAQSVIDSGIREPTPLST